MTYYKKSLIAVFVILLISCSGKTDDNASASWNVSDMTVVKSVEALEIVKGNLVPEITASGLVRGINEVWIVSETGGIAEKVNIFPGKSVDKGDLLLKLEDEIPKVRMKLALQLYKSAEEDFKAYKASFEKGGLSRSNYNASYSAFLNAEAEYKNAKNIYEKKSLYSPISGYAAFTDLEISKGNYIDSGRRIARIVDSSEFIVELSVGERQINKIDTGLEAYVEIKPDGRKEVIKAEVASVGRGSSPDTGGYQVLVKWKNTGELKILSGMSASVTIKTESSSEDILIPVSSVFKRNNKTSVFLYKDGKSVLTPVEIHSQTGNKASVSSGLKEGEIIIISSLTSLEDGSDVNAVISGTTGEVK